MSPPRSSTPRFPLKHPKQHDSPGGGPAIVRAAHTMPQDADILAFLLALNLTCAAKEAAGEPITPPGLPLPAVEHGAFVTEDCIRV